MSPHRHLWLRVSEEKDARTRSTVIRETCFFCDAGRSYRLWPGQPRIRISQIIRRDDNRKWAVAALRVAQKIKNGKLKPNSVVTITGEIREHGDIAKSATTQGFRFLHRNGILAQHDGRAFTVADFRVTGEAQRGADTKETESTDPLTEPHFTAEEVAGMLNISTRTVYRMIASGELKASKSSPKCIRVSESAVRSCLESAKSRPG